MTTTDAIRTCVSCGQTIDHADWDKSTWVHREVGNLYCRNNAGQMAQPAQDKDTK